MRILVLEVLMASAPLVLGTSAFSSALSYLSSPILYFPFSLEILELSPWLIDNRRLL